MILYCLCLQPSVENMELHLGLAISSSSSSASSCSSRFDLNCNRSKKRKHDGHVPRTLPLVWDNFCCNKNQLNEEHMQDDHDCDGDDDEVQSNSISVHHRNVGGVIGWPPMKLCRRKVCQPEIGDGGGGGGSDDDGGEYKSMYIKVHMEGVGIARKVDLNLHQSYQTLVHTLASMFGTCYEDVKLTYQDKEGDWLLAEDVPWGSFVKTIQRLRLVRK